MTQEMTMTFKHKPKKRGQRLNGDFWVFEFPNDRGASVVRNPYSYGGSSGLFEIAVLDKEGDLDYSTPITGDVIGRLTASEVDDVLDAIEALPKETA